MTIWLAHGRAYCIRAESAVHKQLRRKQLMNRWHDDLTCARASLRAPRALCRGSFDGGSSPTKSMMIWPMQASLHALRTRSVEAASRGAARSHMGKLSHALRALCKGSFKRKQLANQQHHDLARTRACLCALRALCKGSFEGSSSSAAGDLARTRAYTC